MYHFKTREFDKKLISVFDKVDTILEDRYGGSYTLHPNRPERGKTANPAHDGLFNIGASFSAGYGSEHGRGYVIDVHMSTLDHIPQDIRKKILEEAVTEVKIALKEVFPDRDLEVKRDGNVFKIVGDFSLGLA